MVTDTVSEDYGAKLNRSINLYELEKFKGFGDQLLELDSVSDAYVCDASITVASGGGYVLGEIWWDGENERWVVDFARYGEEL